MKSLFPVTMALGFLTLSSFAQADVAKDISPAGFWDGLTSLASKCAVVPYAVVNGTKIQGVARAQCSQFILNNDVLTFSVLGQTFTAQVQDSADSDGGDLNDLEVKDAQGNVILEETDVLAYRDVIQALVGSKVELQQVYDSSITQ
jgi:hypothetical protein